MFIIKYPGEKSMPLTYFPAEVPKSFGYVCLESLDLHDHMNYPLELEEMTWGRVEVVELS